MFLQENDRMKHKHDGHPEDTQHGACQADMSEDISAGIQPEESSSDMGENDSNVTDAESRIAALNDKYIRLLAEYNNYRKRTAREMECVMDVISEELLAQFLPILDNLDRATEHRNDKTTLEEYVKGIAMIEDQLRAILAQAGLKKIEAIGEQFDPAVHCAVFQQESKEHPPGTVIAEAEKGYMLQGKIIRHPKVVVSA
jgi:molecular chaperone GrpE